MRRRDPPTRIWSYIAAGFDAAAGDLRYDHVLCTHDWSLAGGKLVVRLSFPFHSPSPGPRPNEGGYNLKSTSRSALAVTPTLMGEPPDRMEEAAVTPPAVVTVRKVAMYQSRYWRRRHSKDNERGSSFPFHTRPLTDLQSIQPRPQIPAANGAYALWPFPHLTYASRSFTSPPSPFTPPHSRKTSPDPPSHRSTSISPSHPPSSISPSHLLTVHLPPHLLTSHQHPTVAFGARLHSRNDLDRYSRCHRSAHGVYALRPF